MRLELNPTTNADLERVLNITIGIHSFLNFDYTNKDDLFELQIFLKKHIQERYMQKMYDFILFYAFDHANF